MHSLHRQLLVLIDSWGCLLLVGESRFVLLELLELILALLQTLYIRLAWSWFIALELLKASGLRLAKSLAWHLTLRLLGCRPRGQSTDVLLV